MPLKTYFLPRVIGEPWNGNSSGTLFSSRYSRVADPGAVRGGPAAGARGVGSAERGGGARPPPSLLGVGGAPRLGGGGRVSRGGGGGGGGGGARAGPPT